MFCEETDKCVVNPFAATDDRADRFRWGITFKLRGIQKQQRKCNRRRVYNLH
jgi:hypothetical protein